MLLSTSASFVNAEIFRTAIADEKCGGFCFYWWPTLPVVDGWYQDMSNSYHYAANTQAPIGHTFSSSETVIYAKAEYSDPSLQRSTLPEFIEFSQSNFLRESSSEITVQHIGSAKSENGIEFSIYSFSPIGAENWEQVAYGEEIDSEGNHYFLIFTLSSRSKVGYEGSLQSFREFILRYD